MPTFPFVQSVLLFYLNSYTTPDQLAHVMTFHNYQWTGGMSLPIFRPILARPRDSVNSAIRTVHSDSNPILLILRKNLSFQSWWPKKTSPTLRSTANFRAPILERQNGLRWTYTQRYVRVNYVFFKRSLGPAILSILSSDIPPPEGCLHMN